MILYVSGAEARQGPMILRSKKEQISAMGQRGIKDEPDTVPRCLHMDLYMHSDIPF